MLTWVEEKPMWDEEEPVDGAINIRHPSGQDAVRRKENRR